MKRTVVSIAVVAFLFVAFAAPGQAQTLRGRTPNNAFQIRLGYFFPTGGGPLWDDVEQRFTLSADDFNDGVFGLSFVTGINNRFEVGFHGDWYEETVRSQERFFVDEDGFAILHDTTLEEIPLAIDARFIPAGRYRLRSGGARVMKPVFYLGAGIGVNIWEYEEVGDFVDENDPMLPIFFGTFRESGEALEGRVFLGIEFPLSPGFNLTFEGRYTWADDELRGALVDLGQIELGGTWLFVGGSFRF